MTQEKILVSLIHLLNEGSKDKRAIESFLGRGKNIDHYLDELNVLGIYPQIKNHKREFYIIVTFSSCKIWLHPDI